MKRNGQEGYSFCGGVLISKSKGQLLMILLILLFFIIAENYVLTAAHCIATNKNGPVQNVEVILGAHKIRSNESSQVRLASTEFFHHEQYDSQSITNDIGLVKLPQSVTQSKYVPNYSQSTSKYYILTDTRKNSFVDSLIICK